MTPIKDKEITIITAASKVFCEKGYSAASMAEIAKAAGIGKGTIYEYFKSKEDLFFAVFSWWSLEGNQGISVSIQLLKGSAAERLVALSDSIVTSWLELIDFYPLVMEFWSATASSSPLLRDRMRSQFSEMYQQFRLIVSTLVQDGISRKEFREDTNPEHIASALVGMWDALLLQAWFDETIQPLEISRSTVTILLRGIATSTGE